VRSLNQPADELKSSLSLKINTGAKLLLLAVVEVNYMKLPEVEQEPQSNTPIELCVVRISQLDRVVGAGLVSQKYITYLRPCVLHRYC